MTDDFSQENSQLSDEAPTPGVAKPRKRDILTSTIDYIQHAEIDKRHMSDEIKLLRSRITAMERLNGCGGLFGGESFESVAAPGTCQDLNMTDFDRWKEVNQFGQG